MSFATLRPWRGSQDRAFEELAFQLLKDDAPPGSVATRTGNPDGGVEWYADLPDGSQRGWQAKNIAEIDDLLRAMTESVQAVVVERPTLTHLTFVISSNLSTGTARGRQKSQRQKYEDKQAAWQRDIPGADRLTFGLVQESNLIDKLALPQHQGRAWFWWQRPALGPEWLEQFHRQQAQVAGDKYRPDLQVDLPISTDLQGLGLSQTVVDEFVALRKAFVKATGERRSIDLPHPDLATAWEEIGEAAKAVVEQVGTDVPFSQVLCRFDDLQAALGRLVPLVRRLEHTCFRRRDGREADVEGNKVDQPDLDRSGVDRLNDLIHRCRSLQQPASALQEWIQATPAQAAHDRRYFLEGPAGSGKTHLLLDAVRLALDEGRPAVVLHGAQFGGELWGSVCDQLGLAPLGKDVLLGAMDAAAEAAGLDGRRFVIMVDALNETPVPGYWATHLPVLRAAVAQWPNLALAVSCRDTYVEVVDQDNERQRFVTATHPGFAGREIEATQKYFDHYGLELPRIPLLTPEFGVPLFLRLYCESLRDGGGAGVAVGHEGRIAIFERYRTAKVRRVTRRVIPNAASDLEIRSHERRVLATLDAVLDAMGDRDSEWLDLDRAQAVAAEALGGDHDLALAIIGALETEGVLSQDPLYLRGQGEGISLRVTFQAFSDFLLLKRRLSRSDDPLQDDAFGSWLRDGSSWGIQEAATVMLPELYGVEFPDFLGYGEPDLDWPRDAAQEEYRRRNRVRHVFTALTRMLPYRSASAVTKRTIDLLNVGLRSEWVGVDLFDILYAIAPQPDNPLNAVGLHRYLAQQSMPRRDASFGFAVYHELSDESSPIMRLARWASLGPYPSYPPQVVELSADALMWLLSSPNRFLRDWVTKSLVQLLHGHLPTVLPLLDRFWKVNDPYIVQRVLVIAYGSLMRGGAVDVPASTEIASWVRDHVFVRPVRPDELLLDAARGIVEWAVAHGVLPICDLTVARRPYGLKAPGNTPTEAAIDERYGYKQDQDPEKSYLDIHSSLFGLGDFGHYVVESHVHRFSRYRQGQAIPERRQRERRFIRSRWLKFERSLSKDQQAALRELADNPDPSHGIAPVFGDDKSPLSLLTEVQWNLWASAWKEPRPSRDIYYPAHRAKRWIFMRTLSLGWTPEMFGSQDRFIAHRDGGRSEHKAERWGKKYQWIAYHEFLARIADNYQAADYFGDEEPYDGPQQGIGWRDIDPSQPPVDYRRLIEESVPPAPTWGPTPVALPAAPFPRVQFSRYYGDFRLFSKDLGTWPSPQNSVITADDVGEEWIALSGFEVQSERPGEWEVRKLEQLVWLHSVLVTRSRALEDARRIVLVWKDWHAFDAPHGHVDCCFAGEIAWTPRPCSFRIPDWRSIGPDRAGVLGVDATESYRWEGNILDCSIDHSVSATMPSRFVLDRANLLMSTRGPHWTDETGQVVAVYREELKFETRALYARASWLRQFLREHDLGLVLGSRFIREQFDADLRTRSPRETTLSVAVYDVDGTLVQLKASRVVEGCD